MKKTVIVKDLIITCSCLGLLIACGGSGGSNEPTVEPANGRLIDSAVSRVNYSSGSIEGTTDSQGRFSYEVIDDVVQEISFSFNNVNLGKAPGATIITPLDFVEGSDTGTPAVQNIARFLQMLDTDGDPANGIAPSMDLITAIAAFSWSALDFTDVNFDSQPALIQIVADINSVDSQTHVLPNIQQAQAHLESSLACLSSGIYPGSFSGDDNGHYVLWIQHQRTDPTVFGDTQPRTGVGSALIYSADQDRLIGVLPQQALAFDNSNSFIVGQALNGAVFNGEMVDFTQIKNGQWRNDIEGGAGVFSGNRVAGEAEALFRLAGVFSDNTPLDSFDNTADNTGGIALDIFDDNRVSGVAVSSRGDRVELSGMLSGDTINANSADGDTTISVTFDSTGTNPLNTTVGLFGIPGFWGSWQNAGMTGSLIGTSCMP